jgi:hypothetical protein
MRAIAAGIVAGVVLVATVGSPGLVATTHAQPTPDVTRAKDLYQAAELAMTEGRYADAARDYGAAYEITKDPVLFFKLGSANERGKNCKVALIYYKRYLRDGKPSDEFATLTKSRITACGGDLKDTEPAPAAEPAPATGSAAEPDPGSTPAEPVPTPTPPPKPAPKPRHRLAWILIGGSIASFTMGAVLAYSANAAENDVDDLYVGLGGTPPVFDVRTRARFDDLIEEGERYEKLSWVGFGFAGALALGAVIRFATDDDVESEPMAPKSVRVTPTISPQSAGVSATVRF